MLQSVIRFIYLYVIILSNLNDILYMFERGY